MIAMKRDIPAAGENKALRDIVVGGAAIDLAIVRVLDRSRAGGVHATIAQVYVRFGIERAAERVGRQKREALHGARSTPDRFLN